MKRIMIIAAIVGIIGLLATATVVVAWGGVRALKNNQAVTEVAMERQPRSLGEYARGGYAQGEDVRGGTHRARMYGARMRVGLAASVQLRTSRLSVAIHKRETRRTTGW